VLSRVDRVVRIFEPDQMATVVYGVYDTRTGVLRLASAGHPPPVVGLRGEGVALDLGEDPPLGVVGDLVRQTTEVELVSGTHLCCYTDGLVERRDRDVDESVEELRRLVARESGATADQFAANLMVELVGAEATDDDVALLVVRRLPDAVSDAA
jgi:serine phosphatase RsbU (regulator of sigma subunit)